jgi:hypothetical protein
MIDFLGLNRADQFCLKMYTYVAFSSSSCHAADCFLVSLTRVLGFPDRWPEVDGEK